jgi:hypothetical protein
MIVVPAEGTGVMMEVLRRFFQLFPPRLRLYTNDMSPNLFDDLSDYDEAAFPGYSFVSLSGLTLTPLLSPPSIALIGNAVTFTPSTSLPGPRRMYGYFVTDFLTGRVLWAERFPKRVFVSTPADHIIVVPRIGAITEFSG